MSSTSSIPTLAVSASQGTLHKETDYASLFQPGFEFHEGITLSSKEGALFRVPSITLRMASGFFRTMLSLPQGQHEEETIQLEEPSRVVDSMLRIVCCIGIDVGCALATIDDLSVLLFAAEKYELPGVTSFARASVMNERFLQSPLQVYSICCRYGWTQEAQQAAKQTLALDFTDAQHRPALDSLSGTSLMALLDLRWKRKAYLKAALENSTLFSANVAGESCAYCGTHVGMGSKWREFKWVILDELEKCPSGERMKSNAFMQSAPAVALLDLKCQNCQKTCISKETTLKNIFNAIDKLPNSL